MYEIFISLRYLRSRLISLIATLVLMLGVAVLLIVTSVMGGFQREFHKKIRGTLADVTIETGTFFGIFDEAALSAEIERQPHVVATAPYVENFVGILTTITQDYGFLRGIDPAREVKIGDFATNLCSPRDILEAEVEASPALRELMKEEIAAASTERPDPIRIFETKSGLPPLVVGASLYSSARMRVGDVVKLYSGAPENGFNPQKLKESDVKQMEFEVVGAFKTGMYEQDRRTAYTTIAAAQEFLGIARRPPSDDLPGMPARVSGINVKLDDYRRSEEVAGALKRQLRYSGLFVRPWNKRNENLIKAVATEQFMIYFIVFFMIVLASVCLASILTLGVIEKTKDLGILGSVGATRGGLMRIFLYQGGIIAALGAALGTALGLVFLEYINEIDEHIVRPLAGRRAFDPSIYYLDRIPTEISGWTIFWCVLPTILLGFLMALYPGYRAATLDPIEALRYE
jgi:lipoprotein-releasing system permease protein